MARYISLIKFTEHGSRTIRESYTRAQAFTEAAASAGVEIERQFWTLGAYDGVLIIRADKPEKAWHCLSELVGQGNVTTETMPAFEASEISHFLGRQKSKPSASAEAAGTPPTPPPAHPAPTDSSRRESNS